eukprot:341419_1
MSVSVYIQFSFMGVIYILIAMILVAQIRSLYLRLVNKNTLELPNASISNSENRQMSQTQSNSAHARIDIISQILVIFMCIAYFTNGLVGTFSINSFSIFGHCVMVGFSGVLFFLAKCVLYSVFLHRLYIVYTNSMFQYS